MNDDRKHLTGREVEKLLAATKGTRHAARKLFAFGARTRAASAGPSSMD